MSASRDAVLLEAAIPAAFTLRVPAQEWRSYRHGVEVVHTSPAVTVTIELDSAGVWAVAQRAARNKSGRSKVGPVVARVRGGAR